MTRWVLLLLLLPSACARGNQAGPASAVDRWIEATDDDDAQAAYALLNKETREQMPYPRFLKLWGATGRERQRQAEAMRSAIADRAAVEERALIGLTADKGAYLVREEEGWRLDAPLLSSVRTPKPQDALLHLRKAMHDLSVDQLKRILSTAGRTRLEELIGDFRTGLRENEGAEVQVSGHIAILEWKDDKGIWRIKLVLENGEWRIDDVFPPR